MQSIEIRAALPKDLPFLFATWLRSYKYSSTFAKRIKNPTFFLWHHRVIERILSRESAQVLVATPFGDENTILGYLVSETQPDGPVIHFVFVKKEFRLMGIARRLLAESRIDQAKACFTHWTAPVEELARKFPGLEYNPYRI